MLLSCNKLKSHIKNSEDIDWLNIWDTFTLRTAEVENVKKVGDQFDNVVIAEIKECVMHPDSDHMHILKVDCGEKELVQVVCGAPNVRIGLKTAYIKVGGHIDGFEIKAKPLRGILSNGMCCSKRELGISDDHSGIIELPEDAPIGMDIKKYFPIEDIIVEIDNKSLTNRPDLWGHLGIAREIAAITKHELLPLDLEEVPNNLNDLDVTIKDPDLCYRYSALKLENIKNNETPIDMQIFLYYVGMRSISLLVDVTNYIMLEIGQPMHAFDSRVVKSIEVGRANDKDTYQTLDGTTRKLTSDMLMIKNGDKYFGIAGVMGGLDSEILSDTTGVFLESATFNAGSIRKTAVALGLRTEASARYEKSLDPNMTTIGIKRALYLIKKENPELEIASNLTDVYPTKLDEGHVTLRKNILSKYMGKTLEDSVVEEMLTSLGFKVTTKEDLYEIVIPTYRHSKDVSIEEDIIEEVARMYGLENFSATPLKIESDGIEHETIFNQEYDVKEMLATKYNMHEVNSYLWYDTEMLKEFGIEKTGVKLLGKTENNILRDDLSFSLLNIVNLNFKNYLKFNIFEIGTIILNGENKRVLSIILADEEKNLEANYNKAKEIVKYIFKLFKNKNVIFTDNVNEKEYYEKDYGKVINVDNAKLGEINILTKGISNKLAKKKSIICIDIDFDKYVIIEKETILAEEVSKYPTVELDYTITLTNNKKYSDLLIILNNFKSNLVKKYKLVSIYENKYTIRYILGSNNKTLEQKDIQNFKDRFINHLKENGLDLI